MRHARRRQRVTAVASATVTGCPSRPSPASRHPGVRSGGRLCSFFTQARSRSLSGADLDGGCGGPLAVGMGLRRARESVRERRVGNCSGVSGYQIGEARVLLGSATAPLAQIGYEMPVDKLPGCKTGFSFGPDYPLQGVLRGGGDLDGDGLDDVVFVSTESHIGGAQKCDPTGSWVYVLPGTTGTTFGAAQRLPSTDAGPSGNFLGRVRILGDIDTSGRSTLAIVGTIKVPLFAGPPGALALVRTVTPIDFGVVPIGGY